MGRIVPASEVPTRMLLLPVSALPALPGDDVVSVECGECSTVLYRAAEDDQVRGIFILCPSCETVNDVSP